MTALYYIGITLLLLFVWPVLIFSSKARFGVSQKLGFVPDEVRKRLKASIVKPIWFHSVSVGEFNAALPLINAVHDKYPSRPVVVSTTTGTGQQLAVERVGDYAQVIYFPYDTYFSVKSWLDAINPALFVIVETEMWPGLITQCKERGVPVVIVNGRISPRSFKSYKRIKWFFHRYVKMLTCIGAQTSNEAERYRDLCDGEVLIETMGNLKCDGLKAKSQADIEKLRDSLSLAKDELVFIAGSTHEGEEAFILSAYTKLLKLMPGKIVRLIIAPRHPQRFDRAEELIKGAGFSVLRNSRSERFKNELDVYLIDSIGHLATFYGIADVAFVGGTIAPIGGHNVLEPYTYKVPVISGPRLEKTRDFARLLEERDALFVVKTPEDMAQELLRLLGDQALRQEIGKRGNMLLLDSQGAVDKALLILEEALGLRKPSTDAPPQPAQERGVKA